MTHFGFLQREWPDIYVAAAKAEASTYPRISGFLRERDEHLSAILAVRVKTDVHAPIW